MVDFPIIVELAEPVVHGEKTYNQLIFTRFVIGEDLVKSDSQQGGQRRDYALYACLAGVPLQVLMAMRGSDIRRMREAASPIMGEFLGIQMEAPESPADQLQSGAS